ncbi:CHRD domain-containing protein [Saccharopolyspora sp. K220]|uniref:CHRD domain-containing protein n=1 Tax=Saccharopolyspora soli TaxID=2926618 RepID=UPI001F5A8D79|nr:CHRD domain-containing protein [Saccharopolyspora soli]MCI2417862.1 CHRD domain-containing protein [Saccharopolyspora soli]
MRILHRVVLAIGTVVLALAGLTVGLAGAAPGDHAARDGVKLAAKLDGAQEVPGPGDPDGFGSARLTVFPDQVCVYLKVSRIQLPTTAAHIHRGVRGVAGPVVVTLPNPATGEADGCVPIDRELAKELVNMPSGFYVNVHNDEFPDGAIRGQLSRHKLHDA